MRDPLPWLVLRLRPFCPLTALAAEVRIDQYGARKIGVEYPSQEESMNMGGWAFIEPRLRALGWPVAYVGRDTSASPATGSRRVHLTEQKDLVNAAICGSVPHLVRATPDGRASTAEDGELIKEEAKAAVSAG